MDQEILGLRRDLAASSRLFHQFGWDEQLLLSQHLSLRVPTPPAVAAAAKNGQIVVSFLVNPPGLQLKDVTVSSLDIVHVRVQEDGKIEADCTYAYAIAFHVAMHVKFAKEAQESGENGGLPLPLPFVKCIFQCQTVAGAAIASMPCGILPLCQGSMFALEGGCVSWSGLDNECPLSKEHKAVVSASHGLLTAGRTTAEAFHYMFYLTQACTMQVAAVSAGLSNLGVPSQRVHDIFASTMKPFQTQGMGHDIFEALRRGLPQEYER